MRQIAFLRNCAIAFLCVLLSASATWGRGPAAAPAPQTAPQITYMFCESHNEGTAYFSEIFVLDSSDAEARAWKEEVKRSVTSGHGGAPPAPWVKQFNQVVPQKNPNNPSGACNGYTSLEDAQRRLAEVIDYEQRYRYKVVQTGWKYSHAVSPAPASQPAPAAPVAAAPAASGTAATQGKVYFCTNRVVLDQNNRKYKEFWSDAFASDAEQAVLSSAWRAYLAATYQLNPNDGRQINGGCGDETTVQITRQWKVDAKQRWERTTKIEQDRIAAGSPGIVEEHTVVDTGWKYSHAASPAPASQPAPAAPVTAAPAAQMNLDPRCLSPNTWTPHCPNNRPKSPISQPAPAAPAPPSSSAARPVDPCDVTAIHSSTNRPLGCKETVTSYTVCYSANDRSTVYISAAFPVTDSASPAWVNGFKQFLRQKYSYQGEDIGCNNMTLDRAPTFLKNRIAALHANRKQVVETGWTYGSSAALPTAGAAPVAGAQPEDTTTRNAAAQPAKGAVAPAPAAPQAPYAVCWAETFGKNPTAYFSVPFDATIKNTPAWYKSFREALNSKYGRASAGPLHCNTLKSQADAQAYLHTTEDKLRAHHKVIETGWKYQ